MIVLNLIKLIICVIALVLIVLTAANKKYIASLIIVTIAAISIVVVSYIEHTLDAQEPSYVSESPSNMEYILPLNDNDNYYIKLYNNGFVYRKFSASVTDTPDTFIEARPYQINFIYNKDEDPRIETYSCIKKYKMFTDESRIYKIYVYSAFDVNTIDNVYVAPNND